MLDDRAVWLAVMLALDVAGSLDLADTGRVYARETFDSDQVAIDVENVAELALSLEWPSTLLELEYAPRMFWLEVNGLEPPPMSLLHTASVRLTTSEERLTVSIGQTLAAGDQSFALRVEPAELELEPEPSPTTPAGDPTGAPDLDLLPAPAVVRVLEATTSASLSYEHSRRLSTELRPSFGVSGGADRASRRALPRQITARIDADLNYRASRRDVLTTSAGVMRSEISTGFEHRLVSLMETWSRSLSAQSGTALGAGVAVADTAGPTGTRDPDLMMVALGRVWTSRRERAIRIDLSADVGHQPSINALTGALQGQLYARAGAGMAAGSTSARAGLGVAQTLPTSEPDSAQYLTADAVLQQEVLSWLSAELGAQITWQSLGGASALEGDSLWLIFAGARAELPSIRF